MRILVTGRDGQLARSLAEKSVARDGIDLVALGRPRLDLEQPESIRRAVREIRPDVIVNAAAYTAVDQAEDEPDQAERINADAAGELAASAREQGARLIHISTDYVFDGEKAAPYVESDATGPLGAYGRTKLEGEDRVRAGTDEHLILRTAWVYSSFGRNFVRTMLRLAAERSEIAVVADQHGSPTSALDLAEMILAVIEGWRSDERRGLGETFHLAGLGSCSWAEFAREIFRLSASLGGPSADVRPIASSQYPTKARRPANSRLDSGKFQRTFGLALPRWEQSLGPVVERLVGEA